jgi:hypothetical protein
VVLFIINTKCLHLLLLTKFCLISSTSFMVVMLPDALWIVDSQEEDGEEE